MNALLHDLRFALRMLRKNAAFTAAAVLTLALGIGLNTAVFSAIYALVLRPLPGVESPDRLVQLYRRWSDDLPYGASSIPHFFSIKEENRTFSDVTAWTFIPMSLSASGENERVIGALVSADFFRVFGVRAALGRDFLPQEDVGEGEHPVVILGHGLWERRFASDPGIVGRDITVSGRPYQVVGVAPADFRGAMPAISPDLYAPLMMQPALMPGPDLVQQRGSNFLTMVARLKPGVTVDQARSAMETLVAGLRERFPDDYENSGILVVPQSDVVIHPGLGDAQRTMPLLMMAVVAMLLLLACVNVANLFLARARDREREMGIRLSIGAARARVVRQLLTEALLFSFVAALAGLGLAWISVRVLNGIRLPTDFPVEFGVTLSAPVLLFTLAAAVLTGVLFGLAPALVASRPSLVTALKGDAGRRGVSRSRATRTLVGIQVALSMVLLVSAGLFLHNLQQATSLDKGFQADNLLLAGMDPGLQGYPQSRSDALFHDLLQRVRAWPEVKAAGLAEIVPMGLGSQQRGIGVPGYEPSPGEFMSIDYNIISDGYFDAMGIPILRGRGIGAQDDEAAPRVAVVNERFASRFWPGEEAVGKRFRTAGEDHEVVGVVPDGKYRRLGEDPLPYMYLSLAQHSETELVLHVRTEGAPEALTPRLRSLVRELDPTLPLYDVHTMNAHLSYAMLPARVAGIVLGIFGMLGLFLAAIGIYGVMAYSVAQRTREIGIRVALGAASREVVGLVVRQGMIIVALGAAAGLALAALAARLIGRMLYSGSGADPLAFGAVLVVLFGAAILATYLPARRAAGVDPVRALKAE